MLQAEEAHLEECELAVFGAGETEQAGSGGGLAASEGTAEHTNEVLSVFERGNESGTGEDREELLKECLTMIDSQPASRACDG